MAGQLTIGAMSSSDHEPSLTAAPASTEWPTTKQHTHYDPSMHRQVLVVGLGHFGGGVSVTQFLVEQGSQVTVTDRAAETMLGEALKELAGLEIAYRLGGHERADFEEADLIVMNPAVAPNAQPWRWIEQLGKAWTAEMNLFLGRCRGRIVGVTGSNGKSTTAAMIAHVLEHAGGTKRRVWLGGNIGRANLLGRVEEIGTEDIVVLELSSFQLFHLGAMQRSPQVAVVTNLSPNHLDWHGTMAAYRAAKQNILRYQRAGDVAMLRGEDAELDQWAPLTQATIRRYGAADAEGIELVVPGRHNRVNAGAAVAVASVFGIDKSSCGAVLADFAGLPHRLAFVREVRGVRYYNDSIATTPESTLAALKSFEQPKVLILGGYDKGVSFSDLLADIVAAVTVRGVLLLGQVREKLAAELKILLATSERGDDLTVRIVDSLDQAVACAAEMAQDGWVALLSPACASYDMFSNFRQRGETFCELVKDIR